MFENYSTRYRAGLALCLKQINLNIPGGSKVAIVGRTGSGKSSLSLSLFRVLEPVEGTIRIDGVDIKELKLETLRKAVTIVPQDPVIFSTTLRENIDVMNEYSDEQVIEALKSANLESFLESINDDIHFEISMHENLSVGQRQLICLARALIQQNKIIVFDEATACK